MNRIPARLFMALSLTAVLLTTPHFAHAQSSSKTRNQRSSAASRTASSNRAISNRASKRMSRTKSNPGFVLLELFTSEGCSSCPPADANLARVNALPNQDRVYTLSYHVDYWNYLGWDDPYSDKAYSNRQREYARAFRSKQVYTPQLVVNGAAEFNGSNQKLTNRAIELALKQTPSASLNLRTQRQNKRLAIQWNSNGLQDGDVINLALVQNQGQQSVTAGENARRNLRHVNVVRHLETILKPTGQGSTTIELPANFQPANFHVVGFVQSTKTGGIKNAAKTRIGL